MIRTIGLALAFVACGAADGYPAEPWTGDFQCGQHRLQSSQGPFRWRLPLLIEAGKITGSRDYIAIDSAPGRAEFSGQIHPDGLAEIAVVGQTAGTLAAIQGERFRAVLVGRAVARTTITAKGPMRGPRGLAVRDCQLDAYPTGRETPLPDPNARGRL